MIRGNVLFLGLVCPFCRQNGETSRCQRTAENGDGSFDYDCALGHHFTRLADGEYRLKATTPRRIEENTGSLY